VESAGEGLQHVVAEVSAPPQGWRGDDPFTGKCSDGSVVLFTFKILIR
jgi:hypothetical protein